MNTFAKPDNPWKRIGHQPPFLLEEDRPYIEAFNSIHGRNEDRKINLYYTPEPRLGPVTAQVILLQLNPSYDKNKPSGQCEQTTLRELENIQDENSSHPGVLPHNEWWNRTLKQLNPRIQDCPGEVVAWYLLNRVLPV